MKRQWIPVIIALFIVLGITIYNNSREDVIIDDEGVPEGVFYEMTFLTEAVINDVQSIEAAVAAMAGSEDVRVINNGTMAFIRSKRYGFRASAMSRFVWDGRAGYLYDETYIKRSENAEAIERVLVIADSLEYLEDSLDGVMIDFPHMVAVIDLLYTINSDVDYEEAYYDYLFSWGGDLETFLMDVQRYSDAEGIDSYEGLYTYAAEVLGSSRNSFFSDEDYYADIDGAIVADKIIKEDMLLSEALRDYYSTEQFTHRRGSFVEHHGGEIAFVQAVRCFMLGEVVPEYTGNEDFEKMLRSLSRLKELMLESQGIGQMEIDMAVREVVTDAFIDSFKK